MQEEHDARSDYFIDAENAAEMARLRRQAQHLTQHFGLLPPGVALRTGASVLDVGCGPGEWACALARQEPYLRCAGIDISHLMIDYATFQAQTASLENAHFSVMDARLPLAFADASFTFIQMRLLSSFLSTTQWPLLLSDCFRLLEPGGIFVSVEADRILESNSAALTFYNTLFTRAMRTAGKTFSREGDTLGVLAMQVHLLQQAGLSAIQQQRYRIEYPAHSAELLVIQEVYRTGLKLVQPFLISQQVAPTDEIELLYEQAMDDMASDQFYAYWIYQQVWGRKPGASERA